MIRPKRSQSLAKRELGVPDITYALPSHPKAKRIIIKGIEAVTAKRKLIKLVDGFQLDMETGESFWETALKRKLRIYMDFHPEHLARIPAKGPVVCVANHPFGVIDGLMLCYLISKVRSDFKVLTNTTLCQVPEASPNLLPISFEDNKEAIRGNLATRKKALSLLEQGGCIGLFPGGTVSTSAKLFRRAFDPNWKTFTAKLIAKSDATVVPIYFRGQNSRIFQVASNLSMTLRNALFLREVKNKIGGRVVARIGEPIKREKIRKHQNDHKEMMEFLRHHTYSLGLSSKNIEMGKIFEV